MSWSSPWRTGRRGRRAPRSWPGCRACARCAPESIAPRSRWRKCIAPCLRCSGCSSGVAPSSHSSPPTMPRWRTSSCRSRAGSCAMRDHPLVQLTLARMREFYREPEAIFWVFGFPIVLAFALGIAFRNRGPGELRVAVLRGAGDSVVAAALARPPGLTAAGLDSAQARLQPRPGRVPLLLLPRGPGLDRYRSTRPQNAMRRSHYLLSFILSRLVFLFLEVAALVGFGWWMFHVGVRGSFSAVAFITVLGALSFAGLGMLVASRARTIEAVSGLMNLVMLPMWILSGTFFSYARFPDAMQPFVKALPLTALNDALRAVMIDGSRLSELGAPLGIVTAWGVVSFVVALQIFRWR